ncbi:MAG: hypothetical protein ACK4NA_12905 [Alphaproteobacteria bacterium]
MIKELVRVQPNVPDALKTCPDEPRAPAPDADEPTFWGWVAAAVEAGDACRQVVRERQRFDAAGGQSSGQP